jgi:hypothetical protein
MVDTKICRFDYVEQPDSTWSWMVEVRVFLVDPHADGGIRPVTYGPMTPEQAENDFGLKLSDVIAGISKRAVTDVADSREAAKTAKAALADERSEHFKTRQLVDQGVREIGSLRDAFLAEQGEHTLTKARLDDTNQRLTRLQDNVLAAAAANTGASEIVEDAAPAKPARRRAKK